MLANTANSFGKISAEQSLASSVVDLGKMASSSGTSTKIYLSDQEGNAALSIKVKVSFFKGKTFGKSKLLPVESSASPTLKVEGETKACDDNTPRFITPPHNKELPEKQNLTSNTFEKEI